MNRRSLVSLIIYLNVAVFLSWHWTGHHITEDSFMYQNFLVSWNGLMEWRGWTLLTSVFSHISLLHIFFNMYVLSNFGPVLERILGHKRFLQFYLMAGAVSSATHCLVSAFLLGKPELPALGASGAISGLILVFSLMFPRQLLLLFGLIPVRAFFGALLFVGLDLWGLISQAEGGGLPIGHGAHLGGALTGTVYFFWVIRPRLGPEFHYW
jgi:membrane associated rhomboid family serine protease